MKAVRPLRLPAAERRQAILAAALRVFPSCSYARATTAEIAREAGVSEPILYRHFASKRDLYLACVDEAWARLQAAVERVIAEEDDPAEWTMAIPRAVHELRDRKLLPTHFWVQALGEAAHDPVIRRHMRMHVREAHDFFRTVMERAQQAGGMHADRDPDAEAWIAVAIGLLRSVEDRLGDLVTPEQFAAISTERRRWLTGSD
jgi:TetR/AcrR family transcriptional regulator